MVGGHFLGSEVLSIVTNDFSEVKEKTGILGSFFWASINGLGALGELR